MPENQTSFLIVGVVSIVLYLTIVVIRRRNQVLKARQKREAAAKQVKRSSSRPAPAPAAAPQAMPRYGATPVTQSGPSLKVNIGLLRVKDDSLVVSWNATNDGSEPVELVWGAPQIQTIEAGVIRLLYGAEAGSGTAFQAPKTRTAQPGDIISRSAGVSRAAAGQKLPGLRVIVAVGYGPQSGFAAASADETAYSEWQKLAVSLPRGAPRT